MNFTFLICGLLLRFYSNTPVLELEVRNIEKNTGSIMIAVYTSNQKVGGENFYHSASTPVTTTGVQSIELKLPLGTYALAVYHDLNDNKQLDTNFFGIPKEPYGFSNDVMGTFGPPDFMSASVDFNGEKEATAITLK